MKMGEKQKDATAEEEEEEMEGQPTTISRRRRDVTSTPIISRALRQTQGEGGWEKVWERLSISIKDGE